MIPHLGPEHLEKTIAILDIKNLIRKKNIELSMKKYAALIVRCFDDSHENLFSVSLKDLSIFQNFCQNLTPLKSMTVLLHEPVLNRKRKRSESGDDVQKSKVSKRIGEEEKRKRGEEEERRRGEEKKKRRREEEDRRRDKRRRERSEERGEEKKRDFDEEISEKDQIILWLKSFKRKLRKMGETEDDANVLTKMGGWNDFKSFLEGKGINPDEFRGRAKLQNVISSFEKVITKKSGTKDIRDVNNAGRTEYHGWSIAPLSETDEETDEETEEDENDPPGIRM